MDATLLIATLLIGFGIVASVRLIQGHTKAEDDANWFKYLEASGSTKADLCRQAEKTAEAYDRQGDLIKFNEWGKVADARCKGFKVEGRPFLGS